MRALAAALLRWLAETLVRFYYPQRTMEGAAHVPGTGPALYVANHPNGLLDPLVLRVSIGHPVRFLAKSTLWGNPFGRLAMDAFGCLPIYRQQDLPADERATAAARNEEAFARCRRELAAGGELALYPEGTSHTDPELKPFKTGAARIALSAAAERRTTDDGYALLLIPVGAHYERPSVFRSAVHLVIGAPIDFADDVARFAVSEREAVESLTAKMRARLGDLVLQAETRDLLAGIARVASWTASDADDDTAERRHTRTRALLAAYRRLRISDSARVDTVARAARQYAQTLERLGVRDPWALEAPRIRLAGIAKSLLVAALTIPIAAWGLLTTWAPYRLSGAVADRLTRDEDVLSTVKMITGFTFIIVAWIAEAIAVGWRFGIPWGMASLVVAPLAAYAALRVGESLHAVREAVHHLGWRRRGSIVRLLADRRRRLAEDVARALREAGS